METPKHRTRPVLERDFEADMTAQSRIIVHVARMYATSMEDRQDLKQEILAQAWRAYPHYDISRPLSTWLYRIALNVGISHLRRASLRRRRFGEPTEDDALAELANPTAPDPELELREQRLMTEIVTLNPLERALVLLYLEERPYAEIAEVLGLSQTNVATKLSRIKVILRKRMQAAAAA